MKNTSNNIENRFCLSLDKWISRVCLVLVYAHHYLNVFFKIVVQQISVYRFFFQKLQKSIYLVKNDISNEYLKFHNSVHLY